MDVSVDPADPLRETLVSACLRELVWFRKSTRKTRKQDAGAARNRGEGFSGRAGLTSAEVEEFLALRSHPTAIQECLET
jgi:hypothetical protein